jgi:PAS domain-containing protein
LKISDISILSKDLIKEDMGKSRREQRSHFLFKLRLANGEIFDVEVINGPIELDNEQLLHSVIQDINEPNRSDQLLRDSESRCRAIFENGPDEVVIFNSKTGWVVEFNDRACQ